jgi:hypothetical protein
MVITLDPELEATLNEVARHHGVAPEALALKVLRERIRDMVVLLPRNEWERSLLALAIDCGVSLPSWTVSSEGIYDWCRT